EREDAAEEFHSQFVVHQSPDDDERHEQETCRLQRAAEPGRPGGHVQRLSRDDDGASPRSTIRRSSVTAMSAGDSATAMPAARSAVCFSAAVPLPPAMIAPAWPMRLPGGAV